MITSCGVSLSHAANISVKDICKKYGSAYFIGIEGNFYDPYIVNITPGETENEVFLSGIYYEDVDISATLDSENSALILNAQELFYDQKNKVMIKLYLAEVIEEEIVLIDKAAAKINEDGKIVFPDNIDILIGNSDLGYLWGAYRFSLTPFFEFNEEDWVPAGKAFFKDGWIAPYFGEDTYYSLPEYELDIMASKKNTGDFLLINPYKNEQFEQLLAENLDGSAKDGFIRFNVSDPDFVTVYPLVNSGAIVNMSNLDYYSTLQQVYDMNLEGFLYFSGDSKDDILTYLEEQNLPVSNYDSESQTATIYNCRFALEEQPLYGYYWNISSWTNPNAILFSTIRFDANAGIENAGIISDSDVVKFYNLQGLEVRHPEKGQILIKVEGNKSSKIIF